jgi:CMP-N,N'-diacetyllegionaminic acid synthase
MKLLAVIPARGGSKRIPHKNIKLFNGKPLISYTIRQAIESKLFDRVLVDTDDEKIAKVAKIYGAEVPFLRPEELAGDKAKVVDALIHLLTKLKEKENYEPTHLVLLQTTSPLREVKDIKNCINLIKETDATTVLTICPTHPRLYYMDDSQNIILANGSEKHSTNIQAWRKAYVLNGCFVYVVSVPALLEEKSVITKKTKAVVCEKWRSVDLDEPEDWVLAEFMHKNKKKLDGKIKKF